jgi:hypothetical protein
MNWNKKALYLIKQGEHYQEYLRMMERKAHLISDLKYLLATLPLTFPVTVDIKNMDSFSGLPNFKARR